MSTRITRVALAGVAVLGISWLWAGKPLSAQSERGAGSGSFRESFTRPARSSEQTVKLNYFSTSWERVLRDVARQTGRELVMDQYPSGRLTRRDRNAYTIPQAVRLLNAELEPEGFRLLVQRKHLVLLHLDAARSRYARPVTRPAEENLFEPAPPVKTVSQSDELFDSAPRSKAAAAWELTGAQEQPVPQQPEVESDVFASEAIVQEEFIEQTVQIVNGKAADVARNIYDVFATRSELNRAGHNGLPSFTVFHRGKAGEKSDQKHFEVAIDRSRNALTLVAPKSSAGQLMNLIRDLDQPAIAGGQDIRVVPTTNLKAKTTQELQAELNRLTRGRQRTSFRPNPDDAFFAQNEQGGAQDPPQAGAGDQRSMNLQGDVILQPLDDLGAVVIKGNQADIETVVGIIEELERLSEGTLPEINLVELSSVNSEALAELLTTVYDRLAELRDRGGSERRNNIAFVPVVKPNAVLALAPAVDMEAILQLIQKLDRPVNPTYEFEVFHLKNAIASQVVTALENFYEEPTGLSTRVRAIADVRTNSVIVQARPSDLEEVAALVEKIDRDEAGKVSRVKVIPLRHASAEELAETINTAIQEITNPPQGTQAFGTNTGASELRDSQSVVLEFLTKDGDIERLIRSGILVDVRVREDVRTNSLIVTAPEASMELMEELIRQLDQAPSSVADIKVFTLERADAEQAVELLTALFEDQNAEGEVGIAIAGAEDAASSLVPLRFSADVRTNTVVAAGSLESLSIVEAILFRLDESESRNRETQVVKLQNTLAADVATAVNNFLASQQALLDSNAELRSNIERLESEIIVEPEPNSNSLIISSTPQYFEKIKTVIDELDAYQPQVVIQALLVEVELDNTDEFGIELGFQDPTLFNRSIISELQTISETTTELGVQTTNQRILSQGGSPGFLFNSPNPLGNNVSPDASNPGRLGTQGISNFSLGRQNNDLGFGGFVFSASSNAVSVLVRALAARRNVHVLSRPQIRTLNNRQAEIQVGQNVPVVSDVSVTNNGVVQPIVTPSESGIILRVTPIISPNGTIVMDVYAEKSDFNGGGVPIFVDVNTGSVVESPIKNITTADARVSVPNGQTIVMGGMITKSDETLERKVPWLGDVPLLGQAFRFDGTNTSRRELLIFLTPRIVNSDADNEIIKQVEAERIHFIESEAEEIHGPIFSVPQRHSGEELPPASTEDSTLVLPPLPESPEPRSAEPEIDQASAEVTSPRRKLFRPLSWIKPASKTAGKGK